MKRIICALLALLALPCLSLAETDIIESPQIIIEMITPSPSPEPVGETFSSEDLIVTLPAGLSILDEDARKGYDAAVQFDYPAAGRCVLLAADARRGAAAVFSILDSDADAAAAARDAALSILGSDSSVEEVRLGENSFSAFRCAVGPDAFRLFFLSSGSSLLCVGTSGLEDSETDAMLAGLIF